MLTENNSPKVGEILKHATPLSWFCKLADLTKDDQSSLCLLPKFSLGLPWHPNRSRTSVTFFHFLSYLDLLSSWSQNWLELSFFDRRLFDLVRHLPCFKVRLYRNASCARLYLLNIWTVALQHSSLLVYLSVIFANLLYCIQNRTPNVTQSRLNHVL